MRDHETKGCLCRTLELSPEEIRENPVPSCLAIHIMMEFFFLQSKQHNLANTASTNIFRPIMRVHQIYLAVRQWWSTTEKRSMSG